MMSTERAMYERQIDRLNEVIDRLDQTNCKLNQKIQILKKNAMTEEQKRVYNNLMKLSMLAMANDMKTVPVPMEMVEDILDALENKKGESE